MSSKVERCCANAPCEKVGIHLCSGCGEEIYCSKECQKSHWTQHKAQCQSALRPKAAVSSSQSFDALSLKQLKNVLKAKVGSYDTAKKQKILDKLEKIVEKPELVKLVSDHVKISEVDTLLATPEPTQKSPKPVKQPKKTETTTAQPAYPANTPTPEQMKQQAAMMKKNPELVRRSNPALAHFTDAQIREYAEQLELAASNPEMMKEIAKMSKMTPTQREKLQYLQEGLSGAKPMDEAWINSTVQTIKYEGSCLKSMLHGKGAMFGGFKDDQVDAFIESASQFDESTLKFFIRCLIFLGSLIKPTVEYYKYFDKVSYGMSNYVFGIILFFILYFSLRNTYFVLRYIYMVLVAYFTKSAVASTGAASSTLSSTGSSSVASSTTPDILTTIQTSVLSLLGMSAIKNAVTDTAASTATTTSAGDSSTTVVKDGSSSTTSSDLEDF